MNREWNNEHEHEHEHENENENENENEEEARPHQRKANGVKSIAGQKKSSEIPSLC